MPNQDGTGPLGDGRPGRGLGLCGRPDSNPTNRMFRGRRANGRCGFGWRGRRFWGATPNNDANIYPYEKEELAEEKTRLEKALNWVLDRLKELDK